MGEENEDKPLNHNPRRNELIANLKSVTSRMREALRRDFCAKLSTLSADARNELRTRLVADKKVPGRIVDAICSPAMTYSHLIDDEELAKYVDAGSAVEPLLEITGSLRRSFVTLLTASELFQDWLEFVDSTSIDSFDEWQLLSSVGMLALPIEVKRSTRAAGSPYDVVVTRVCATPVDTASLVTALRAKHVIVPPEGGVSVEDGLLLVDPDAPRSSKLALSSALFRQEYASLVVKRELGLCTEPRMHLALHAHALFEALQPPARGVRKEDLEAQMRRQYLGRAYQCASCNFGPIDHFACGDLAHHNGQRVGEARINNACPRCGWFSRYLSAWPKWDGAVPDEALMSCVSSAEEPPQITAASAEAALRICYSARHLWDCGPSGEAQKLLGKLADWETLTADDGVEHIVQLLLALVTADDVPEGIFGPVPMAQLLNEVCARGANNELQRNGKTIALRRVGAFLGVSFFTAPRPLKRLSGTPVETQRVAALESCRTDYKIDPEAFDFKSWVKGAITPWANAIMFARRLRCAISARHGGWRQLARDMEAGPSFYADVIRELQRPAGKGDTPAALYGVRDKESAQRILATVAAQAFLHAASKSRRTKEAGGDLDEPLGDVRDESTLKGLVVEVRMAYFDELAGCSDHIRQKIESVGHIHSLTKREFWDLWEKCYGENVLRFLTRANQSFVESRGLELF
eukprot:TRINITY_DN57607_c0_g1_i1.p1 TRINITY_DN57607_c0_g1~~TRINITY_DN57607_c0_g1_i1.p1  ORF type:complete len:694 (-),score=58.21 TRINITY_DN57607_c0_g1_i1:284-2365(-)